MQASLREPKTACLKHALAQSRFHHITFYCVIHTSNTMSQYLHPVLRNHLPKTSKSHFGNSEVQRATIFFRTLQKLDVLATLSLKQNKNGDRMKLVHFLASENGYELFLLVSK